MQKPRILLSILIWELIFQSQLTHQQILFDIPGGARNEKREDESAYDGKPLNSGSGSFFDGRLLKREEDFG